MKLTRHKRNAYIKKITDYFYYIPLLSSLKQLLSSQTVMDEVCTHLAAFVDVFFVITAVELCWYNCFILM